MMTRRYLGVLSLFAVVFFAACSEEGRDCGDGTIAEGNDCLPDPSELVECGDGTDLVDGACVAAVVEEIVCGDGTELVDGACVSNVEEVECGPDTELVDGECVSSIEEVICGPDTELVDGECVPTFEEVACGEGTILIDGSCELIDPFDGITSEPGEPNDPVLFEDADFGVLELGAAGETVLRTGVIEAATEVGEDDEAVLNADFDVFVFEGEAGTRISFEATAVGAPELALALIAFPEDDADNAQFIRLGFAYESRNASKEVVLPFTGAYMLRIGTAVDTAGFLGVVTDGQLSVGNIAGDPTGAEDFTWILGVTVLEPKDPQTFAGNGSFTFEGDVREAPQAIVDVEAGTIIGFEVETDANVAGAVLTGDTAFENVDENLGLVVVPEGGLSIVVDSLFDRANDTSFKLTAIEQPRLPQGELEIGVENQQEGTLVGNSFQFFSFTLSEAAVVSVQSAPAEGSDANTGLFLTAGDISETIAVSNDNAFGAVAVEESLTAFLEAGDYQVVILHENLDDENGDHPFVLTMLAQGVTDLGELAVDAELTATDETLATVGSSAFYTVTTAQLGLLGGSATPEINLDVAVDVFDNPFLTARDQTLSAASSNDGLEGDVEQGSFPAGAGLAIIRLTNAGALDLEESFNVELSVTLGEITFETEPNDDAGEPSDLGLLEEQILLGGTLALGEETQTTIDFYIFEVTEITDLSIAINPVGENPATGMRLSLFDDDNINEPLAVSESFIDFFSGQEVQPLIETVVEPGVLVVTVQTIDDTASGDYLMTIDLNEALDCVPNATRCDDNGDLEVCTDGFTLEITECGELTCNQVADFFGCGIVGEEEPNNGPDEANDLGDLVDTQERIGAILLSDDEDWYTFSVADRAQITVRTESVQGIAMDTILTIFDENQVLIATNDDFDGFFSQVSATSDGPATFFVRVESFATTTGPYNVIFEAVVAECAEGDPETCGEEGIIGCDGFFLELVETCGFGCEDGDEGPACVIPEFVPETEPNDSPTLGVGLQVEGADVIDSFPFTMQGNIAEPGDDTDFYVVSSTNRGTFIFETSAFGENDVEDTKIAVCDLEQVFGPIGCTLVDFDIGNNIAENDDNDIPGDFYSRVEVDLPAGLYFVMVESFGGATGDYLIDFDFLLPGEPNNTPDAAFPVSTDFSGDFAIEDADDLDFFTFDISQELLDEEGGDITLSFTLGPQELPDARLLDTVMGLCQAPCLEEADQLAFNDDGGPNGGFPGFYSQIIFNFDTPGSFILVVSGLDQAVGDFNLTIVDAGL